jgi:hypothetical protein
VHARDPFQLRATSPAAQPRKLAAQDRGEGRWSVTSSLLHVTGA